MPIPTNQLELDQEVLNYKSLELKDFEKVLNYKVNKIADYLRSANIRHVVMGISGGIDSAVVLGLLCKVKEIIPLHIHCYTIDFDVYNGIFDTSYIDLLKEEFGHRASFNYINASNSFKFMMEDLGLSHCNQQTKAQSSYALRYQMLFTYAQVYGAVTVGTTNRDEFEYSGWFGKNSDMVVDLQVIADWHKFQVVKAAKVLNVPSEIILRAPVGDLLDMSTDEENFGCTYNELAYFAQYIQPDFVNINPFVIEKFAKLRALHEKNKHKYQGQTFNPVFI